MATNGEIECMTSSDLDVTSQTETEDTDTGDQEDSGTTFTSSDGNDTSFTSVSTSSKLSKPSTASDMRSVSSADGSTSTGNLDGSDTDKSDTVFKYPSAPKVSYDLTEVSELSNFENLSNYGGKFPIAAQKDDKRRGISGKKGFQFPDFMSLGGGWYTHPCFRGYWDHYNTVMSWCNKHYNVANSVLQKGQNKTTYSQFQDYRPGSNMLSWQQYYFNLHQAGQNGSGNNIKKKGESSRKRRSRKKTERSRSSKVNEDLDETFEMEITEDLMEFFRQSEEHRRLRDDEKQAVRESAEKEEEHINIEDVKVTVQKGPTTEAPKGRPGAKRTSEMKLLYGKGAPMVHGMETALQMTFDRNLDIKEPKLWPNMPLKLVFG